MHFNYKNFYLLRGEFYSPNSDLPKKVMLNSLLNELSSNKSISFVDGTFVLVNYCKFLRFIVYDKTDKSINFKIFLGTNLTFSSQEILEFNRNFYKSYAIFIGIDSSVVVSTNIIRYNIPKRMGPSNL